MPARKRKTTADAGPPPFSNGAIAAELMTLAQLLAASGANPFKVKAYRRAARTLRTIGESIDELVRSGGDLTAYPGIGPAISSVIQEIVQTGKLRQMEKIRAEVAPEILDLTQYPYLDPKRVQRIYKKLRISSTTELRQKLENGEIVAKCGAKMAQHVRQGLMPSQEMLLYEADRIVPGIQDFLIQQCGVRRAEPAGDYRRRVEVVRDITFLVETEDLPSVLRKLERYGGRTDVLEENESNAQLQLSTGVTLRISATDERNWGMALVFATGSEKLIHQIQQMQHGKVARKMISEDFSTEETAFRTLGLSFIPPELREGRDEIELAALGRIPTLVSKEDIIGELHAHSTSSDGANTIEEMAVAAKDHDYEYVGISDHSQTLRIARGLSESELWEQIRFIDALNDRLDGIRVLKSAEVDILADGSLDYSEDLLKELDYTICSIHSRFGLGKADQTDRIRRAMDNRYFNILGHATGRLLLKRPGYEIDVARVIEHARASGCFFEINSSPDRLDLSAGNARLARDSGVRIAITTDAHSVHDFGYLKYGIDQARRAGFEKQLVLNHLSWPELERVLRR